jgi:hydroxyacylglutathione hydrolase
MNVSSTSLVPIPLGFVKAFLIRGERPILIDTGYRGSEQRILAACTKQGVSPGDLALILITHCHSDHVGSLEALLAQARTPVAICRPDATALRQGTSADMRPAGLLGRMVSMIAPKEPPGKGIEPDVVFDDELDLSAFGVRGRAIATPGHTAGSSSVILEGGEAIVGDMVMGGFLGRGRPRKPFLAHDLEQCAASLRALLALEPTAIHPSHGGPFAPDEVKRLLEAW